MVRVQPVELDQLVELRRRVLRANDPKAEVIVAGDRHDDCFHLGILDGDDVVACVSAFPESCPDVDELSSWQFRFMAVDERRQGEGLGRLLLGRLLSDLHHRGAQVAWANGRDTAQGFYEAMGFTIVDGSAHASPSTGLPHHRIFMEIDESWGDRG